jgi:hypothetical protein
MCVRLTCRYMFRVVITTHVYFYQRQCARLDTSMRLVCYSICPRYDDYLFPGSTRITASRMLPCRNTLGADYIVGDVRVSSARLTRPHHKYNARIRQLLIGQKAYVDTDREAYYPVIKAQCACDGTCHVGSRADCQPTAGWSLCMHYPAHADSTNSRNGVPLPWVSSSRVIATAADQCHSFNGPRF